MSDAGECMGTLELCSRSLLPHKLADLVSGNFFWQHGRQLTKLEPHLAYNTCMREACTGTHLLLWSWCQDSTTGVPCLTLGNAAQTAKGDRRHMLVQQPGHRVMPLQYNSAVMAAEQQTHLLYRKLCP